MAGPRAEHSGQARHSDGRTGEAEQSLAEAENAYRLAVKLDGRQAEAHIALVEFLSGRTLPNGQPDPRQAQKTKEALVEAMSDLPARESHAAFARMYEAVRDKEHAELEYKAALDAFPDDPATIREVAFFYLRAKELNTATPLLQKLVDGKKTPLGDLIGPHEASKSPIAMNYLLLVIFNHSHHFSITTKNFVSIPNDEFVRV